MIDRCIRTKWKVRSRNQGDLDEINIFGCFKMFQLCYGWLNIKKFGGFDCYIESYIILYPIILLKFRVMNLS